MPQLSVHELLAEMEAMVEDLREELAQNLDFTGLEQVITARLNELGAELVKQVVEPLLIDAGYVERLKGLGGQRGLKFKEYRSVRVRLGPVKIEFPDLPYLVIEQGPAQDGDEWYSSTGDRPRDASSSASSSRRQRPFCRSRRGPQANGLRPAGPFGWLSRGSIPTSSRRSARAGRPN